MSSKSDVTGGFFFPLVGDCVGEGEEEEEEEEYAGEWPRFFPPRPLPLPLLVPGKEKKL
jgi:hypothetical protein